MDINYLLAREQISLMRAAQAAGAEARRSHAGLARGYAAKLIDRGFPHQLAAASKSPDRARTTA
ncbi:hypothetical protein EAH79_05560 [Sphingomonas koreensis]|nr:hypothetical protein EAH87_12890 [Sphingomonas koreensis]TPG43257.1 hypothetical protein EAH79_05560 [Sphingomonas koreensis]